MADPISAPEAVARIDDIAAEMAHFEAAYPACDATKYRDSEVVAGRVRYAKPDIDKMFSAWLSGRRFAALSGPASDEREAFRSGWDACERLWHAYPQHPEHREAALASLPTKPEPPQAGEEEVLRTVFLPPEIDEALARLNVARGGKLTGVACSHGYDTFVCPIKGCGIDEDEEVGKLINGLASLQSPSRDQGEASA